MWLMGFGIFILLDSLVTIWIASVIGAYFAVAAVGSLTWLSLAILFTSLSRHIRLARTQATKAVDASKEFKHISSLIISALFVISPGILTDIVAWILYIPPIRLFIGSLILNRNQTDFDQLQQHLAADEP
jgi:UPF0716 family protein affecting phage T7 exclusion